MNHFWVYVHLKNIRAVLLATVSGMLFCAFAPCQTASFGLDSLPSAPTPGTGEDVTPNFAAASFDTSRLPAGTFDEDADSDNIVSNPSEPQGGLVRRSVKRILQDQKGIYLAPFKPQNFKWDAIVLAGTAGFLVADRHIEGALPDTHHQMWQNMSNVAIAGLSATLAGVWLYGVKTEHHHARETGELELETLVNTFLVYTPMQFIAARERPGEGNGHGDFLKHPMINTSFPGGHAMFTWAMATVVAHEYSQPWVRALTYGAAFTVTLSRFMAHDHWASDMWVGTGLGLAIGTYTFHAHCDPELSSSCRRHYARILKLKHKSKLEDTPLGSWPNAKPTAYESGRPISQ